MKLEEQESSHKKMIVKICHICAHMMESEKEQERCTKCRKSFLPINYSKYNVAQNEKAFQELFHNSEELHQEDLVIGIHVIW